MCSLVDIVIQIWYLGRLGRYLESKIDSENWITKFLMFLSYNIWKNLLRVIIGMQNSSYSQGPRKVSNIGRTWLWQPLDICGAATPFLYYDSEILVGLQPLSPTYSYGPVVQARLSYDTSCTRSQVICRI